MRAAQATGVAALHNLQVFKRAASQAGCCRPDLAAHDMCDVDKVHAVHAQGIAHCWRHLVIRWAGVGASVAPVIIG